MRNFKNKLGAFWIFFSNLFNFDSGIGIEPEGTCAKQTSSPSPMSSPNVIFIIHCTHSSFRLTWIVKSGCQGKSRRIKFIFSRNFPFQLTHHIITGPFMLSSFSSEMNRVLSPCCLCYLLDKTRHFSFHCPFFEPKKEKIQAWCINLQMSSPYFSSYSFNPARNQFLPGQYLIMRLFASESDRKVVK